MKLFQQSARVLRLLEGSKGHAFTREELQQMLAIPAPRLSDILNVLQTVYVVQKDGPVYSVSSTCVQNAVSYFLADHFKYGVNNSISEYTKTVCYLILIGEKPLQNRRTSDVLNILLGIGVVEKQAAKWVLTVRPQINRAIELETVFGTPMSPPATEILSFSDFDY